MTKEITKAVILQEIQDKFKLREFEPSKFLFDETVVPIYDLKQHLEKVERIEGTYSITALAAKWFFTVPETQRWRLSRYNVIFVTGVYTVAGLFIARGGSAAEYVYLDLAAAQSASYINDLPKDAILNPGDQIYVNVDGYTSTGDLLLICDVVKEEIR